jgi:hypothetical protein
MWLLSSSSRLLILPHSIPCLCFNFLFFSLFFGLFSFPPLSPRCSCYLSVFLLITHLFVCLSLRLFSAFPSCSRHLCFHYLFLLSFPCALRHCFFFANDDISLLSLRVRSNLLRSWDALMVLVVLACRWLVEAIRGPQVLMFLCIGCCCSCHNFFVLVF